MRSATTGAAVPRCRDLEQDLDVVAAWKPAAVVTLIEDFEFAMLGVPVLDQ